MAFRKLRGVPLPKEKQGLIYYTCLNFDSAPEYTRRKILRLCGVAGGEYAEALFMLVTKDRSITELALKCNVSEETLRIVRRRFYTMW